MISISRRLLRSVLSVYLLVTLAIFGLQVGLQYREHRANVEAELSMLLLTSNKSMSYALWNMEQKQLRDIATDLLKAASVGRVSVILPNGDVVINERSPQGERRIDLLPQTNLVTRQTVERDIGNGSIVLGTIELHAGGFAILERLKPSVVFAAMTAMLKTAVLALLVTLFFDRTLSRPLMSIARRAQAIDPKAPDANPLPVKAERPDELDVISNAINGLTVEVRAMLDNLAAERALLEQRVDERTQQLKRVNDKLATLSYVDELTQIANRRRLNEVLQAECLRLGRSATPLSVILLDVDHFKQYNDRYGHVAGDACLRQIARVLAFEASRSPDLAARYGGEEFAIVLPETPSAGATALAERVRLGIERLAIPHDASRCAGHVTVSLGVVTVTVTPSTEADAVLQWADEALYQAKKGGRNRTACTTPANDAVEGRHGSTPPGGTSA